MRAQLLHRPTSDRHKNHAKQQAILTELLKFSGFPEPYFAKSEEILNIWRQSRNEKIVREDLRDLSRLPELSQIEMLTSLLPERVGSPLSVQSLREDLEVAHDTVSRWLNYLNQLYYFFEIKPWSRSIARSLKKSGKIYLYDWSEISNPGAKFENLVAGHLQKACDFWTDTGEGRFDLHYLRNKENQEIDFLITRNSKPWLCVESKLKSQTTDSQARKIFLPQLNCPYLQIVAEPGIWRAIEKDQVLSSAVSALERLL